jgi:hypothetical protein
VHIACKPSHSTAVLYSHTWKNYVARCPQYWMIVNLYWERAFASNPSWTESRFATCSSWWKQPVPLGWNILNKVTKTASLHCRL